MSTNDDAVRTILQSTSALSFPSPPPGVDVEDFLLDLAEWDSYLQGLALSRLAGIRIERPLQCDADTLVKAVTALRARTPEPDAFAEIDHYLAELVRLCHALRQ